MSHRARRCRRRRTRVRQRRPLRCRLDGLDLFELADHPYFAAGREPAEVATIYNFGGAITDTPQSPARDSDGRWLGGTVEQWIDELTGAVVDHGASGFIYRAPASAPSATALARWAREIVPTVREAIGPA